MRRMNLEKPRRMEYIIFLNRSRHRKYSISLDISNLGIGWMIDALERKNRHQGGYSQYRYTSFNGKFIYFPKNALFFQDLV